MRRAWTAGLHRKALKDPLDRALFHFIAATVGRSLKHRLFLAGYGGFGAALAISSLASGPDGVAALPFLLCFVLVSAARAVFQIPSELPANWAFRVTEDHTADRYLPAMRKWIVACALVPLFAFLAIGQFALLHPALAAFRLIFQFITALLLTELLFFRFRSVAFTCAHLPGKTNLVGLCTLYFVGLSVYGRAMAAVQSLAGSSLDTQAICLGVMLLVLGTVRRVGDSDGDGGALERPDFNGVLEVEIRTLDLAAE